MCAAFVCNCLCDQGFSRSRRSVKQNSFWRVNTHGFKKFRVTNRQFNHLTDTAQFSFKSAYVLIADLFSPFEPFQISFIGDLDFRITGDNARAFRFN